MYINSLILDLELHEKIKIALDYAHINLDSIETETELNEVLQCNVNSGKIDLIEFIIICSGN